MTSSLDTLVVSHSLRGSCNKGFLLKGRAIPFLLRASITIYGREAALMLPLQWLEEPSLQKKEKKKEALPLPQLQS